MKIDDEFKRQERYLDQDEDYSTYSDLEYKLHELIEEYDKKHEYIMQGLDGWTWNVKTALENYDEEENIYKVQSELEYRLEYIKGDCNDLLERIDKIYKLIKEHEGREVF